MTAQRWFLPVAFVLFVCVVNGIFAWLSFPSLGGEGGSTVTKERWELPVISRSKPVNVASLIAGGFWGEKKEKVAIPTKGSDGLVEAEAKDIRRRVKAIVVVSGEKQVLFDVEGEYLHVKEGALLPGTQWRLVTIESDRLVLGQSGQVDRELNLYSDNTLTGNAG